MSGPVVRLNAALEGGYRIERQLGEGGMATVYLADDLRHERKVALKVLKPDLAAVVGAERFLAEIKTTANLQHPHILPLFDSGEADGFLFYVMPYVRGESLRERLDREKQLAVDEAIRIATNVAEALDYAHRQGVIHRDIKPANILLQDDKPVVSDFGIALAVGVAGGGRLTETGLSMGTPHYMSPEQATGDLAVGAATDIYALGCVLYEMLVGEPPYTGSTAQAILGKIIQAEPVTASKARHSVPLNVDAAIRKSLEKLSADRFRVAHDFAQALADPEFRHGALGAAATGALATRWRRRSVALAGVAALASALAAWLLLQPEEPLLITRQALSERGWAGLGAPIGRLAAVAPDGSSMVLPIELGPGRWQLGLKMRSSVEIVPIPGTEQGVSPAYSPDGDWITYRVATQIIKRPVVGGSPVTLAEDANASGTEALDWLDDGTILYEAEDNSIPSPRGILRISEDGGEPLDTIFWPEEPVAPAWAHGLPGGRGALVISCPGISTCLAETSELYVVDFERPSQERKIVEQVAAAWYLPTGHLMYVRGDGAVFAWDFDLETLETSGSAVPLFDRVRVIGDRADMLIGRRDGTLLYVDAARGSGIASRNLFFVNRTGQPQPVAGESQPFSYPRFSPEGGRLAVAIAETPAITGPSDLWVLDLVRGTRSRITFGGDNRFYPVWEPSGDRVATSDGPGVSPTAIFVVRADGSGGLEPLIEREGLLYPTSWSSDGRVLAFYEATQENGRDLWMLPLGGEPEPFLVTPFQERAPAFSPDGRWVAYSSNKSGRSEIYVQPYPGPGREFTISTDGGTEPVWSRDGSELFYRTDAELMAVDVTIGQTFTAEAPQPLFPDPYLRDPANNAAPNYDVSPDGLRFVMVGSGLLSSVSGGSEDGPRLILVENFFEDLKRLAPN